MKVVVTHKKDTISSRIDQDQANERKEILAKSLRMSNIGVEVFATLLSYEEED